MTKAQHTPGPWRIIPGDSVVHVVAETDTICATNRKAYWEKIDETDLANARLIAAAPELVAALKAIRKEAKKNRPDPDIIFQEADAALSRTEGEQT